jgi:hypothetical protein
MPIVTGHNRDSYNRGISGGIGAADMLAGAIFFFYTSKKLGIRNEQNLMKERSSANKQGSESALQVRTIALLQI